MADRNNTGRPLKPTLASTRVARTPLTPRIIAASSPSTRPTTSKTPSAVSAPPRVTPRVKQEDTLKDTPPNGNITPRSLARKSRVDSSQGTPTQDDTPSTTRLKPTLNPTKVTGLGISAAQPSPRTSKPVNAPSGNAGIRAQSPQLVRGPGRCNLNTSEESIDSRFFHASDAAKQALPPRQPEPKKSPTFLYADGKEEPRIKQSPKELSPVLSAVSESRVSGPKIRPDGASQPLRGSPMLSPALSSLSNSSPYFAAATGHPRSPSPSKENIHLSYRKGASQIFGTRPTPRTSAEPLYEERRDPLSNIAATAHRKSPSLSSIESGGSPQPRRRSATGGESTPSPLAHEIKSATLPIPTKPPNGMSAIKTSFDPPSPDIRSVPDSALSPTKSVSELAADARRERKVLDLEISNSSLLAINASLEREIRRQKTELKRFRRLSRAGRFSFSPTDRITRLSEGLSILGEEGEDGEYDAFGPSSAFSDIYDDLSSDETESVLSSGEPISPGAQRRESDRLAKDEKRLRVDLEKHKELLIQSQMMNQTIKRCTYATEDMIREGKKALEYNVRVSDIKIGGRVLTGHEDEEEGREEIEVEDDTLHGDDVAHDFLKVWQGVGRLSFENSENGDRDSGIEADRSPPQSSMTASDSGRPPE